MDRTSRTGVFICVILLLGLELTMEKLYPPPPPKPRPVVVAPASAMALTPPAMSSTPQASNPASTPPLTPSLPEQVTMIENPALKVTLTSKGAAIKEVELKQHKEGDGHVVLNQQSRSNVLELKGWPGADTAGFQVTASSPDGVVYATELPGGVKWERSYAFSRNQEADSGMSGYLRVLFHKLARHLGQPEAVPLVYTLDVKDSLTNPGAADVTLPVYSLSVGRAQPLLVRKHYQDISNIYLGSGWLAGKFHLTTYNDFNPGSIPLIGIKLRDGKDSFTSSRIRTTGTTTAGSTTISGISTTTGILVGMDITGADGWVGIPVGATVTQIVSSSEITLSVPANITSSAAHIDVGTSVDDSPLRWIGVENQFFAVLLTPSPEHLIEHGEFQCFNPRDENGYIEFKRDEERYILPGSEPDIEASAYFPALSVPAGKTVALDYSLYAGPKDFNRLDALGDDQGELMNYGWFELLIVPMLTVLHFWFLIFHNYGVAIILLTLMIKAITWPLQSIANHSGKRMQALAPKLKELQARYKDHPEKLQTETFAMYREYGVNPFGGCLPALVQMPVFFSLYFMLQNAVELRGQSFLWVRDLTQPDTVHTFTFPVALPFLGDHLALNLLPIMVTGLTMVMMRMTPQIGDPTQARIAQWMPLIFLFIFYNFAAALSLYYVINNCVSIIQIYRNLRKPLPELKRVPRKKTAAA